MITAYIVTVRPGMPDRYTDSIWISKNNADRRAIDLVQEFARRGNDAVNEAANVGWAAWTTTIQMEDAVIVPVPVSKAKEGK